MVVEEEVAIIRDMEEEDKEATEVAAATAVVDTAAAVVSIQSLILFIYSSILSGNFLKLGIKMEI